MIRTTRAILAGLVLAFCSAAQAQLTGDTVTCSFTLAFACSSPSAVVTPAPEFTLIGPSNPGFIIDIGASSIDINVAPASPGAAFIGSGTDFVLTLGSLDDAAGNIVGIANFVTANTFGLTASHVSFTAHSINFTFDNASFNSGASASFDLVIGPSQVMEPTTLALLGIGLAGLGFSRRKRPVN